MASCPRCRPRSVPTRGRGSTRRSAHLMNLRRPPLHDLRARTGAAPGADRPGPGVGPQCGVLLYPLADSAASGWHAIVKNVEGRLAILDLGSTNRTKVRGGPVLGRGRLRLPARRGWSSRSVARASWCRPAVPAGLDQQPEGTMRLDPAGGYPDAADGPRGTAGAARQVHAPPAPYPGHAPVHPAIAPAPRSARASGSAGPLRPGQGHFRLPRRATVPRAYVQHGSARADLADTPSRAAAPGIAALHGAGAGPPVLTGAAHDPAPRPTRRHPRASLARRLPPAAAPALAGSERPVQPTPPPESTGGQRAHGLHGAAPQDRARRPPTPPSRRLRRAPALGAPACDGLQEATRCVPRTRRTPRAGPDGPRPRRCSAARLRSRAGTEGPDEEDPRRDPSGRRGHG